MITLNWLWSRVGCNWLRIMSSVVFYVMQSCRMKPVVKMANALDPDLATAPIFRRPRTPYSSCSLTLAVFTALPESRDKCNFMVTPSRVDWARSCPAPPPSQQLEIGLPSVFCVCVRAIQRISCTDRLPLWGGLGNDVKSLRWRLFGFEAT
jgi:hypothetical protein